MARALPLCGAVDACAVRPGQAVVSSTAGDFVEQAGRLGRGSLVTLSGGGGHLAGALGAARIGAGHGGGNHGTSGAAHDVAAAGRGAGVRAATLILTGNGGAMGIGSGDRTGTGLAAGAAAVRGGGETLAGGAAKRLGGGGNVAGGQGSARPGRGGGGRWCGVSAVAGARAGGLRVVREAGGRQDFPIGACGLDGKASAVAHGLLVWGWASRPVTDGRRRAGR